MVNGGNYSMFHFVSEELIFGVEPKFQLAIRSDGLILNHLEIQEYLEV